MPKIIGLTGLIGTGKTTIAGLLRRMKIPVHDADVCVHQLYQDPKIQRAVMKEFPFARTWMGQFDRTKLMDGLKGQPGRKAALEAMIHPLVQQSQMEFLRQYRAEKVVVLDVPLLFEAGMDALCDEIWVTTSRPLLQKKRVLKRPGFTEEKFNTILRWQGDGRAKERAADHVFNTGMSKARLVQLIRERL